MASKRKKKTKSNVVPIRPPPKKKRKKSKRKKAFGPQPPMFRELSEFEAYKFHKEWEEMERLGAEIRHYKLDSKGRTRRVYSPEEQAQRDAKKASQRKAANERARFARRKKKATADHPSLDEPSREITAKEIFAQAKVMQFPKKKPPEK